MQAAGEEGLMCRFCVLHGKGNKWFHHVDNFEKRHLDDKQRLELARAIYLDTAGREIPVSLFMSKYGMMLKGMPVLLKTPLVKYAARPAANRLMEKYHVGQVITIEEARRLVDISGHVALFDCWCRHRKGNDEACCMGVGAYGDLADDIPELKHISISPDEAIAIMEQYEDKGSFHSVWTVKAPFISTICNCDNSVCHGTEGLRLGVTSALHKGHEYAMTLPDKCNNCNLCIPGCPFGVRYESGEVVIAEREACFGCGLCRRVCPEDAIRMVDRP
ncbi:MAG: 4Fe-4S binding protein [Methanosarcinales archaeon]|nr:4Fe-4S binding protein [ANME-2 cluster archaeon]MDF1531168.1 4Fe-4S binding protein [ANME-2 cluster archaeon]MDW7774867.1 4Fe-4S binding protein [Methanosarcinales archaeon]